MLERALGINGSIRTLIVDPGHGGASTGCAHNGIIESIYALMFAECMLYRLNRICAPWTVGLTRMSDTYTTFDERERKAATYNPDLILSIHVNASEDKSRRGAEFFPRPNCSTSQALAETFARCWPISSDVRGYDWTPGVRRVISAFASIQCPMVLCELAFASSEDDALLLGNVHFRDWMLSALCCGLSRLHLFD